MIVEGISGQSFRLVLTGFCTGQHCREFVHYRFVTYCSVCSSCKLCWAQSTALHTNARTEDIAAIVLEKFPDPTLRHT